MVTRLLPPGVRGRGIASGAGGGRRYGLWVGGGLLAMVLSAAVAALLD